MIKKQSNILTFILLLNLTFLTDLALAANALECLPLNAKNQFDRSTAYIEESGSYCLTMDLTTKPRFDMHAWSYQNDRPILKIRASNVEVDLQNYILQSSADSAVTVTQNTNLKNGTIRNGIIGIRAGANGYAGFKKKPWVGASSTACRITYSDCEDVSYLESGDKKPPAYKANNIHIDNVKVLAKYRGIVLGGGSNIIRNSTIEIDGHTGIFIYGPNPIIENNTIIIHGKGSLLKGMNDDVELKDGAIKLRDAQGGIIRNNTIIYKGGFFNWGKAPAAINLLDSKDVVIEGNTIKGFDKLVRENGDTSFTEKNNTTK